MWSETEVSRAPELHFNVTAKALLPYFFRELRSVYLNRTIGIIYLLKEHPREKEKPLKRFILLYNKYPGPSFSPSLSFPLSSFPVLSVLTMSSTYSLVIRRLR